MIYVGGRSSEPLVFATMRHTLLAWLFCVAAAVGALAARIPASKPPKGFATTKGRSFYVDGKPFVRRQKPAVATKRYELSCSTLSVPTPTGYRCCLVRMTFIPPSGK